MGVDYGKPKGKDLTGSQRSYIDTVKKAAKQRLAAGQGPKKKLAKKMPARQGFDAGNYKYPR